MKYREDCAGLIRLMDLISEYNRTDWTPTIASMFEPNPEQELLDEEIYDLSRQLDVHVPVINGYTLDVRFNFQGRKRDLEWREFLDDLIEAYHEYRDAYSQGRHEGAPLMPAITSLFIDQIRHAAFAADVKLSLDAGWHAVVNDSLDAMGFKKEG